MKATWAEKHYTSAHSRMFSAAIDRFFKEALPQLAGPEMRAMIVGELIRLFERYSKSTAHLKPGQMLWVGVDKNTRPDSRKVKYHPIVLTLVNAEEITALAENRSTPQKLLPDMQARILREAYEQGTLISPRDIALIFKRHPGDFSTYRKQYEAEHDCVLPSPATLQDMGSGVTHKAMILRKIIVEKKTMAKVREESEHTQKAIDNYLKGYRRVEMLLEDKKTIVFISQVTGMSPHLILQYESIYNEMLNRH